MPPTGDDGVNTADELPDFIAVAGSDGIAGYVPSRYFVGDQPDANLPVYARDLRTLVGYMVPDVGFVPLDADPDSIPQPGQSAAAMSPGAATDQLTLFVRNQSPDPRWVATLVAGTVAEAQGYREGLGVGCLGVEVGTQLVVLSGPPQREDTHAIQIAYTQGVGEAGQVWVDFGPDGQLSFGRGEPDWWPDQGTPCG